MTAMALAVAAWGSLGHDAPAFAASAAPVVEVIGATPIDSIGVPLSQFPANAQRLGEKENKTQGTTNLADLLNNNLGSVSVSNSTGNPYQNDVNYRGFQATSSLGAPVGLSVYLDGVRMNEPFGSIVNWDLIPTNALASVDLLPGSNPLFGLNTLGGALVVNTKNGQDDAGASITLTGGSFNRRALKFENGWVDEAHDTDYFLAGNVDKQNGYRQHNGSDVHQFYAKGRWHGHEGKTLMEVSTALANTTLKGTQSLPMDMMNNPAQSYTWPDRMANQMALFNLKGSHWFNGQNQVSAQVFSRQSNASGVNSNAQLDDGCFNADGGFVLGSNGVPKCANQAPNGTALNSVTGANAQALGYGRWTSSINTSLVESVTKQAALGSNLQWSNFDSLWGLNNAFAVGGAYDHARLSYSQNTTLAKLTNYQIVAIPNQAYGFTSNGLAPSSTNLPAFTGSPVLSDVGLNATTNNLSAFLTDTLSLTEKLSVTVSGSFNFSNLSQRGAHNQYMNTDGGFSWSDDSGAYYNPLYANAYKYANSGSGAASKVNGVPAGAVAGPETNNLDGNHHYKRFNPAVGFNYNFDKANGLFGNYSQSMRAPTSIELSCANPAQPCALPTGFNGDPDLKAVVAKTLELGGRGKWGGNTRWSAAVYDSRLSNDIQFISTTNSLGYFANVGDTERRGLELSAQTKWAAATLALNYGWVDAKYRSAFTTASGQNVVSGDKIPGIARQTLKARATYAVTPDLLAGVNWVAAGQQIAHGNESNKDPAGVVPGYSLLNLDLHYQMGDQLLLSANLNNALNKQYATYGLSGATSLYTLVTQQFVTPAAPRSLWLSLTYRFGGAKSGQDND